jgi:hypothetical protein
MKHFEKHKYLVYLTDFEVLNFSPKGLYIRVTPKELYSAS